MYFSKDNLIVHQSYARNAFALAPTTAAIELAEAREFANARTGSNRLDCGELADDFEVHVVIVANAEDMINLPPTGGLKLLLTGLPKAGPVE